MKHNLPNPKKCGTTIRRLRELQNLSQQKLATITGLQLSQISYFENGKRLPNLEALLKLAKAFNCSIQFLLFGSEYEFDIRGLTSHQKLLISSMINKFRNMAVLKRNALETKNNIPIFLHLI